MSSRNFLAELKRRNVYKVAVAYAVVAWLLVQIASTVFPIFDAPVWAMKALVAVIAAGFPVALVLAWAFEITSGGIVRPDEAPEATRRRTGAWIYVVVLGAAAATQTKFLSGSSARMRCASRGWWRRSARQC